jgi:D-sedoheptulose 7-phosphate isomerase
MKPALGLERLVADRIEDSMVVKQALLRDGSALTLVADVARAITSSIRGGGTVFFFGNGGSAADAQHLAAELAGRYLRERPGLPGIALTTNTSCLTAISNDYGYDLVFSRQLRALGSAGDVAIGISTSGNSASVLRAVEAAREKQLITVGMTGAGGGKLKPLVNYCLCVASEHPARIQEMHILIGHIVCEIVEEELFNEGGIS